MYAMDQSSVYGPLHLVVGGPTKGISESAGAWEKLNL